MQPLIKKNSVNKNYLRFKIIVKPFHLCMYSVHILSICPMSRATNENERQLMRERLCGYAVSQLLWTLCHSWRSIDRTLMCPFIPPSLRSHFHGCIVLCASADCLCSVTLQTVWTLYYMLPSGPQSLRCLARLIHPSIHFPLTNGQYRIASWPVWVCVSFHCGRKPEFPERTDTDHARESNPRRSYCDVTVQTTAPPWCHVCKLPYLWFIAGAKCIQKGLLSPHNHS